MRVWFTSDLHIGHDKVNLDRFPEFTMETEDLLAYRWDQQVREDDIVWVLGDISSGKTPDQWAALDWIDRRPGRKRLILGNHDGPHPAHRDAHKWTRPYVEVFEHVSTAARIRVPMAEGHRTALLSHFPYNGDHSAEDRYVQWRLRDEGELLVHGHVHSKTISSAEYPRMFHVGVDAVGPQLVSLEELSLWIQVSGW